MIHLHFIRSLTIWLLAFCPVVLLSYVITPLLLLNPDWNGQTTIFGNRKYPRSLASSHYKYPTRGEYWREIVFYCFRNPVSNFGHTTLAIFPPPYEYTDYRIGFLTFNFGYKASGTFKFRPTLTTRVNHG